MQITILLLLSDLKFFNRSFTFQVVMCYQAQGHHKGKFLEKKQQIPHGRKVAIINASLVRTS